MLQRQKNNFTQTLCYMNFFLYLCRNFFITDTINNLNIDNMKKIKILSITAITIFMCFACDPFNNPVFTVTFDSQGGSAVEALTNVAEGSIINEPVAPVKEGFAFDGWYKEIDCINAWNFSADKVTGDTTLYAKWNILETYTYSGTLNVTQPDSSIFSVPALLIQFITTEKADSALLYLQGVKFSSKMPVSINMKLPVKISENNNQIEISGDQVIPLMLQGGVELPFPAFQANEISGTILGDNLTVTMTLHSVTGMPPIVPAGIDYPMDYSGARIAE